MITFTFIIYVLSFLINLIDVAGDALKWGISWTDLFNCFIPVLNSIVAIVIIWY